MPENKSRLVIALFAALVIALSVPGVITSWHLVKLHYKKPGRTLELMNKYPVLKPIKKHIPDKYLMGIGSGASASDEYDPYDPEANEKAKKQAAAQTKIKEDCDFNKTWTCTGVDESKYSEIGGIGVAVYGVAGYALLILLGIFTLIQRPKKPNIITYLIALGATLGFAFSVYLTIVESSVLHQFCPHCVKSAAYMAAIFTAVAVQFLILRKEK